MYQDWQPIDTAPKDGSRVLVFNGKYVILAYYGNARIWDEDNDKILDEDEEDYCRSHWVIHEVEDDYYYSSHLLGENEPTHWMPLPEPPKE
jgi:hypothetical protein